MSKGLFRALSRLTSIPVRIFVRPNRRINAAMWDTQYALGLWNYLDGMSDGTVPLSLIESWAPRPTILDLGCGTSANLPLTPGRYRHYHGVDISRKAIAQARALDRPDTSYEVADIRTFRSTDRYDAILLREVIYYLSATESTALLRRLPTLLTERGRIVVQVYDMSQTREFVEIIRSCGVPVVAEIPTRLGDGPTGALFVLGVTSAPARSTPGELASESTPS